MRLVCKVKMRRYMYMYVHVKVCVNGIHRVGRQALYISSASCHHCVAISVGPTCTCKSGQVTFAIITFLHGHGHVEGKRAENSCD